MNAQIATPQVAVVGCGYWGKNLVRNYSQLGALKAIVDHHEDNTARLSKEFNIKVATIEAVIADAAISGIVIATPGPSHFELAQQALRAGKHVYVEKPLTLSVASAEALAREARKANRILMVGHLLRYHGAFEKVLSLVQNGTLGPVRHVLSTRFNMGKILADEDVLWALGPHDISMVMALLGRAPQGVHAQGNDFLRPGIADHVTLRLDYGDNIAADIRLSWMHPHKEHKLTVIGEKAMLVFDDLAPWESKLTLYRPQLDWNDPDVIPSLPAPEHIPLEPSEPLRRECAHFLECIADGTAPLTDDQEAIAVLRVVERAAQDMQISSPHSQIKKAHS